MLDPEISESEYGTYQVRTDTHLYTVHIPAGVGLPGVSDEDLLVAVFRYVGEQPPQPPLPSKFDLPLVIQRLPDMWLHLQAEFD